MKTKQVRLSIDVCTNCGHWFCSRLRNEYSSKIFLNKKRHKQENVWFSQYKDGKRNVDFEFKCLKFHLNLIRKNDNNWFCAAQASQQVNESVIESGESPSCSGVLLGQITRCCANFFKISLFLFHQFVLYSSLIAGSISSWKWKLRRQNRTPSWLLSTNGIIQIVMRLVG